MEENKKTVKLLPEQEKAVLHNDGNIIVSASAGSGKTFVMIERLIRLILEGKTTVNGVLAMTFTESAADEMREKLKEAICKKIMRLPLPFPARLQLRLRPYFPVPRPELS